MTSASDLRPVYGGSRDDMPHGAIATVGGVRRAVGGWATFAAGQLALGGAAHRLARPGSGFVYADDVAAGLLRTPPGDAGARALAAGAERLAQALARFEDAAGIDEGGVLVAPALTAESLRAAIGDLDAGSPAGAMPIAAMAADAARTIVASAAGVSNATSATPAADVSALPMLPTLPVSRERTARAALARAARRLAARGPAPAGLAEAVARAVAAWETASVCGCPAVAGEAAAFAEDAAAIASRRSVSAVSDAALGDLAAAAASAAERASGVAVESGRRRTRPAEVPAPPVPEPEAGSELEPEPEPVDLADGAAVAQLAARAAPRAERGAAYQAAVATYLSDLADRIDAATRRLN